jgi:hypothetical protein
LRRQLLGIAWEPFGRRPDGKAPIEGIMAASGSSRPPTHHHFPSRQGPHGTAPHSTAPRSAADKLLRHFADPFGARVPRTVKRFFDDVDAYGPAFMAPVERGAAHGKAMAGMLRRPLGDEPGDGAFSTLIGQFQVLSLQLS